MVGAVDRQHKYITLQAEGAPGSHFDILAESYAGHGFISVGEGPIAHGRTWLPETPAQQSTMEVSTYGIWDETVFQLWMDVNTLWELREMLDPDALRVDEIDAALKEMTLLADVEAPRIELLAGALAARDRLRPVLAATNGTSAPVLWGFGHAHIDVAWLWPLQETQRKTARTFSNQLALMEEYPEYIFLQSEAQLYAYLKHDYPDLYERVKARRGSSRTRTSPPARVSSASSSTASASSRTSSASTARSSGNPMCSAIPRRCPRSCRAAG